MARRLCRAALLQVSGASAPAGSFSDIASGSRALVAVSTHPVAGIRPSSRQAFPEVIHQGKRVWPVIGGHTNTDRDDRLRQSRKGKDVYSFLGTHRPFKSEAHKASLSHEDAISAAAKAQAEEAESISAAAKAQEAQEAESHERVMKSSEATTASIQVQEPVSSSTTEFKAFTHDVHKIHPLQRKSFPESQSKQFGPDHPNALELELHQPKHSSDRSAYLETAAHTASKQQHNSNLLVDTLKITRSLEERGMPADVAESITEVIADTVASNQRRVGGLFQNKSELQTISLKYQTKRENVQHKSLETHVRDMQLLDDELESIRTEAERIRMEIKQRTLKSTTDLKLSLSMQRKGVMEEMQALEKTDLETTAQIRQELNRLSLAIVQMKMDIVNFSVGTAGACSGAALAMIRIWTA